MLWDMKCRGEHIKVRYFVKNRRARWNNGNSDHAVVQPSVRVPATPARSIKGRGKLEVSKPVECEHIDRPEVFANVAGSILRAFSRKYLGHDDVGKPDRFIGEDQSVQLVNDGVCVPTDVIDP